MNYISDYITLYSVDATKSGDTQIMWQIPQRYYNTQRGDICVVSLVSSAIYTELDTTNYIVKLMGDGKNSFNSNNRNGAVLGFYNIQYPLGAVQSIAYLQGGETPKIQISARPSQIFLKITDLEDNAIELMNIQGVFTLKFEYYDVKDVNKDMLGQMYNRL